MWTRESQAKVLHKYRQKTIALAGLCALVVCPWMAAQQTSENDKNGAHAPASADEEEHPSNSTEALQKATQNPVANLISVPLQNNTNFDIGPYNRTQDVLNIQPVIPTHLTKNWMLISRIIQPIVWQPYPTETTGGEYGFGDMNPTFFLSPAKPKKIIWGAGPAFVIPTATDTILGQGKFSLGPSFVALAQPGHWTIGALINKCMVRSRLWQPTKRESDAAAILRQLQPEKGLVHFGGSNHHRQLEGKQWKRLDCTVRRGCWQNHEAWIPTSEYPNAVLRQCGVSVGNLTLGNTAANCISVPKDD
jgi:hypothetical protein